MKSVVVDVSVYDWEGDAPLKRPSSQTIVYEMHVGGFTRHPSSGLAEQTRGTFAGLLDKIPYLQRLGITAVELLPVFQFDSQDAPRPFHSFQLSPTKLPTWYRPTASHASARARGERQLRDVPRRVHAERSRFLQR